MGAPKSECAGCGATFNGVEAFNAHRVGKSRGRRCLTRSEMLSRGFTVGRWGRLEAPQTPRVRPRTGEGR